MNSKRNILITGGSGFIGSHAVRHFYHSYPNDCIVNLDLLTYAGNKENLFDIEEKEKNLKADAKRYMFVKGDICDARLLDKLFKRYHFDLVLNFAAETHVDRSIVSMGNFIRTNVNGVLNLIEAIRAWKTPRFVQISTDEVYGDIATGTSREDAALRPSSPYSSSKAAADLIIHSFVRTHGLPAHIVRGSNNFGPHQYPEKLIPLAITSIIEGVKIPVHGKGNHRRSWLHVEDFCEAIDLVSQDESLHEIYNVSGEDRTNLEILEGIANHLNTKTGIHITHVNDRPGVDKRYAPDATKIKTALHWVPKRSIGKNMGNVVRWYLSNEKWWKKIKAKKEYSDHYAKQLKGQWF
ncbi:MAG: dTDP-glucose 4,6-dehydratase [Patescibacteria group bacterium]